MTKKKLIKLIKSHISTNGVFGIGELDDANSIYIGNLDDIVALAEYFTSTHVEVFVYHTASTNCNSIHEYNMNYEDLTIKQLAHVLAACVQYELQTN
jgi:hypothetical protein